MKDNEHSKLVKMLSTNYLEGYLHSTLTNQRTLFTSFRIYQGFTVPE